jgi:hypothetical protein
MLVFIDDDPQGSGDAITTPGLGPKQCAVSARLTSRSFAHLAVSEVVRVPPVAAQGDAAFRGACLSIGASDLEIASAIDACARRNSSGADVSRNVDQARSYIGRYQRLRLPKRHPACRRREAQPGSRMERENLARLRLRPTSHI